MLHLIRTKMLRHKIPADYYHGKCVNNINHTTINNVKKEEDRYFYNGVCFSNTKYEKINDFKRDENYHYDFNGVCFRIIQK